MYNFRSWLFAGTAFHRVAPMVTRPSRQYGVAWEMAQVDVNWFITSVGPITIRRCTEAVDPKSGFTFRTIANPHGRCVEIASGQSGSMLMDRRLARQVAEAILAICGPAEELPSDVAAADTVEIEYDAQGKIVGFKPYLSRTGSAPDDARAFIAKVRQDKGLPPSDLLDIIHAHG